MKIRMIIFGAILFMFLAVLILVRSHALKNQEKELSSESPPSITKNIVSNYSFVFSDNQAKDFAILGTAALGKEVTLLEKDTANYCTAVTTTNRDAGWANPIEVTSLVTQHNCKSDHAYSVAVIGTTVKDYHLISYDKVSDDSLIKEIDLKVRNSSAMESLKTRAQDLISGYDIVPFADVKPTLYTLHIPNRDILLASYTVRRGQQLQEGPRVVIINGNYYPLTGWCSYPDFRVFVLNGTYYIESGSYCCGCGITIQELFEIKNDGVVPVWADSSYSD